MSLTWEREPGDAPLLWLQGVRKQREQAGSRFELEVPEFVLERGEFVALVGESGCGKSTLLDLLALISRPTRCGLFDLGLDPQRPIDIAHLWEREAEAELAALRRRRLGYVLQTGGLLPYLTVRENLRLPGRLNRLPGLDRKIGPLAQRIGVAECLNRLPERLSGGQRQRVAILRALVHGPSLVLADEPTAAVDRQRALDIVGDLRAMTRAEGMAVVMVTHDLGLAALADRRYGFRLETPGPGHIRSTCLEED
jgi:putative ABC transport system ATP-binding protein